MERSSVTAGSPFARNERAVLGRPEPAHPSTTGLPPGRDGEADGGRDDRSRASATLAPAAPLPSRSPNLWDRGRELDRRMVGWMWEADGRPSWLFYLVVLGFNIQVLVSRALRGGSFWAGVLTGFLFCGDLYLVAMAVQAKRRSSA
jgi:hypothetical protein